MKDDAHEQQHVVLGGYRWEGVISGLGVDESRHKFIK